MKSLWRLGVALAGTAAVAACERAAEESVTAVVPERPQVKATVPVTVARRPQFDVNRLSLTGITTTHNSRQAWISLDKSSLAPQEVGSEILGGKLIAIEVDYVVFEVDGLKTNLAFARPPAPETRPTATPTSQALGSIAKALSPENGGGGAPLAIPAQTANGNATFIKSLEDRATQARTGKP